MTSEARDAALLGGQPVMYMRFTRGAVNWYYTNGDSPRSFLGETWTPAAISRGKIQDGGETQQQTLEITLPKTLAVAGNWRPYPPADTIMVTVWTQHDGETDALVDWIGRCLSPKFDDTTLTLQSEPSHTAAQRAGNGPVLQRVCDLTLFSAGCGVDLAAHQIPATLSAVSGLTLTASAFLAFPSGRLARGWIEWTRAADGIVDRRDIVSHSGNSIVINASAQDIATGLVVDVAPGCSGTWDDCTYYANTDNLGAELFMPGRNYYDGNPV